MREENNSYLRDYFMQASDKQLDHFSDLCSKTVFLVNQQR